MIRDMSRPQLQLLKRAFLAYQQHQHLTATLCVYFVLQYFLKMHVGCSLKFMSKSMRSTEKKEARGKISEREEINGGVRTESRMREKQN